MAYSFDTDYVVNQGDTSPTFSLSSTTYTDISSADWTGTLVVKAYPSGTVAINKAMTKNDANTAFTTWLTPTETDGMDEGRYVMYFTITNSTLTPPFNSTQTKTLYIRNYGL